MAKQSNVKGGGIGSRVVKEVGYRTGQPSMRYSPGGVSQIGESVGNRAMDNSAKKLTKGADPVREGSFPAGSVGAVKLGNEVALNVGKGGPGKGREVMRSGTQSQHGNANPGTSRPGADKPIFPGFK